jgi:adenine phosphoribosyltransferase
MHRDAIRPGQSVILVDDLLATGGTMAACAQLVEDNGARVLACILLLELFALKGRERLVSYPTYALIPVV